MEESKAENDEDTNDVPVRYVPEQLDMNDPALEAFADVFARFQLPAAETSVSDTSFDTFNRPTHSISG